MSLPNYTFVPWLRQGLAAEITEADRLGQPAPAPGPAVQIGRPTLAVELKLGATPVPGAVIPASPSIKRDVQILGPGDVAALKSEAILRTYPAAGTTDAAPDELAFVEFYDEDLPWRYTPARPVGSRLRPWLALLVLAPGEWKVTDRGGQLPVLTLAASAPLPPATETWAWAHAQLSEAVATAAEVDAAIARDPDHARSRLIAPRRLEPDTDYRAFLVPAFEAGRLAGLDRDFTGVPAQQPAWGEPHHTSDRDVPVYHQFAFRTGTLGDFETLALRLEPRVAGPAFGSRPMDISAPRAGVADRPGATTPLEGALAPPTFHHEPFDPAWDALARDVRETLDAGADAVAPPTGPAPPPPAPGTPIVEPLVVPPAFGLHHKGRTRVLDAQSRSDLAWLAELNLDLRSRAAAGLGAAFVRERQDELMQRAWEQVQGVEAANQRLREAELARATSEALMRKHLEPLKDDDRLTMLTAQAQPGLTPAGQVTPQGGVTPSLRAEVDGSAVPAAAQSPAFRRLVRPQRKLMQRLGAAGKASGFQSDLLTAMDDTVGEPLTAAPAPPDVAASVPAAAIQSAVQASLATLQARGAQPFAEFLAVADGVVRSSYSATENFDLADLALFSTRLRAATRARFPGVALPAPPAAAATVPARTWALANALDDLGSDGPGRARIVITDAAFEAEFSDDAFGKSLGRVTVVRPGPADGRTIGRTTALADVTAFRDGLAQLGSDLLTRTDPDPLPALGTAGVVAHVIDALQPAATLHARVASTVPAIGEAPLAPVQAHPVFPDPLFDPLRALGQDFVIPNISDLPSETITLMEPNRRFIEAYLAGANVAMNQELLWREYPTDQRGTPFKVFWDKVDALDAAGAADDIPSIHTWTGQLGAQSSGPNAVLVLVVRGALLERFPTTVVTAQRAAFVGGDPMAPRTLDTATPPRFPIFTGRLDPDIRLIGFALGEEEAKGRRVATATDPVDPGWFFVFTERPGEPRFGLDAGEIDPAGPPAPAPLATWNDLAWPLLSAPAGSPFVHIAGNEALTPVGDRAVWGRTAADQASILLQAPVILARHASGMLP